MDNRIGFTLTVEEVQTIFGAMGLALEVVSPQNDVEAASIHLQLIFDSMPQPRNFVELARRFSTAALQWHEHND